MPRPRDEGAAALWSVLLVALLLTMLLTASLVVEALAARSRAAAAADLAALASAPSAASSSPAACSVASGVVAANGAQLLDCGIVGGEVRLVVEVPWQGPLRRLMPLVGGPRGAQAQARAGMR